MIDQRVLNSPNCTSLAVPVITQKAHPILTDKILDTPKECDPDTVAWYKIGRVLYLATPKEWDPDTVAWYETGPLDLKKEVVAFLLIHEWMDGLECKPESEDEEHYDHSWSRLTSSNPALTTNDTSALMEPSFVVDIYNLSYS